MAPGSINFEMTIFGHILNKAVEWQLLEVSPFKKGKKLLFRLDNGRCRYLTEEEIGKLLDACISYLRPIVQTALLTGMRKGEILTLKWDMIRDGYIYLDGSNTKSGKSRQIPIHDDLAEVFKEVRQANQLRSEYVFCKESGARFDEISQAFEAACKRAGITDFTFHDLRHTFASHMIMSGTDLTTLSRILGHASVTMTMRYAHLSKGHLKEAVTKLDIMPGFKKSLRNAPEAGKITPIKKG